MWLLYQIAYALALLLAAPFLLAVRGRHYLKTLPGRLGFPAGGTRLHQKNAHPLWMHAVSVGEVAVAAALAPALPPEVPLLITTVTPTGQERARQAFAGRAEVAYLPFELGPSIRTFFRRFSPRALVLAEGDLWPLVLRHASNRGLPVVVVNGRISDRSFKRMRRLRRWLGPTLGAVDRFGVQTEEDRRRLMVLGVESDRIVVTGNLKFDSAEPDRKPDLEAYVLRAAAGRPVWIAGSTMRAEEEKVLDAAIELTPERALLVLAPRHPERWDDVAKLVLDRGLALTRRSSADGRIAFPAVLLLDSMGELAALYRIAAAAFIGGTLVETGGHNPIEAAQFGVPIVAGGSMQNFRWIADQFDAASAWRRVKDSHGLAQTLGEWFESPAASHEIGARGAALVAANKGASERTRSLLQPILREFSAPASERSR